jgi:hypothetical protein
MAYLQVSPVNTQELKDLITETLKTSDVVLGKKTLVEYFDECYDHYCFVAFDHQNSHKNYFNDRKQSAKDVKGDAKKTEQKKLEGFINRVYYSNECLDFIVLVFINSKPYQMIVSKLRGNRSRMSLKNGISNMKYLEMVSKGPVEFKSNGVQEPKYQWF